MVVAPWFGTACPMVVDDGASGPGPPVDALAAEPSPTSASAASAAPTAAVVLLIQSLPNQVVGEGTVVVARRDVNHPTVCGSAPAAVLWIRLPRWRDL